MDDHPPGGGDLPGRKPRDGKNNSHGCSAAGEAAARDEKKRNSHGCSAAGKAGPATVAGCTVRSPDGHIRPP